MTDTTLHVIMFMMSSGALAGIVLILVWVGQMKERVDTLWRWWCNHAARGTKIRMKDEEE